MDMSATTAGGNHRQDRFALWPFGIALAWSIAFGLLYGFVFPLAGVVFTVTLMMWPVAAVGGPILAIERTWRKKWRQAASTILLWAWVVALPIYPGIILRPFTFVGVWAHFLCVHNAYQAEVAAMPQDKGPRMVWFSQGAVAMFEQYVVYDETDHLASLPYRGVSEGCNNDLMHLVDHYYACLENEL